MSSLFSPLCDVVVRNSGLPFPLAGQKACHNERVVTPASPPPSQTLSRGIQIVEILAEAERPLTITQLAETLGVHRSIVYRMLRTLEAHGLVARSDSGAIRLGARLATLARSVAHDLQTQALPHVSTVARTLGMTAFVAVLDRDEVVTLVSVEPPRTHVAVAQRPGDHHPVTAGAPGVAIQMSFDEQTWTERFGNEKNARHDLIAEARRRGFATSHDEVIPGLTSVAVPLVVSGQPPAAVAVVYLSTHDDEVTIAEALATAAHQIRDDLGVR